MMLKLKLLAALAAVTALGCVGPPPAEGEMAISRQGLKLEEVPHTPESMSTLGWERGRPLGLATSGAQSAYLVMYRDPSYTNRFLAFGYDPVDGRNLFVFSVLLNDEMNFKNQWNLDIGQWKASRGTSPTEEGTTDGIGGTTPPPRPQLDDLMWEHAFHHYSIQTQIEQGGAHP